MYVDEYCGMGPSGRFTHVMSYDVDWDRLGTIGRAPRTRETLPDFCESCRVIRHSRVFCGLTDSQWTLGEWDVTTWYQSLGIRIPRELGLGIHHHLVWFDVGLGMRLPRKARNKTRTLHACVIGDCLMCFMCDHVN